MRIAAFTGGPAVPSARFRVRQFVAPLARMGIALDEMGHGGGGVYPPARGWRRPLWAAGRVSALLPDVIRSRGSDAVLLQREMISSFCTLERFTGRPRILDVDDAIHLLRGGTFARTLAQACDRVIVGNDYLAEVYRSFGSQVTILPTAIDTQRYAPFAEGRSEPRVIGWIGTSANFPYLEALREPIKRVLDDNPDTILRIVADRPPSFYGIGTDQLQFWRWSERDEVAAIRSFDIGIMPLADSEWARGKCSFKMLQYMACGLPVVVSPVGMNAEVLAAGPVGLSASTNDDWYEALTRLLRDGPRCAAMGAAGRTVVEQSYSVSVIAPQLAQILRGVR